MVRWGVSLVVCRLGVEDVKCEESMNRRIEETQIGELGSRLVVEKKNKQ